MLAAFASTEITPPIGTGIIGWLRPIPSTTVADPLFARIGILQHHGQSLAIVSLDVLSFRWSSTNQLRQRVAERYGFPADRIMVSATHNHAGPAVNGAGEGGRDDAFLATLLDQLVDLFGEALEQLEPAELGMGHGYEWRLAKNRRVVFRDGYVRTHGRFTDPDSLYVEGPIDPEVGVIAVRALDGRPLGLWVNHTCHPTHHGSDSVLSAGWPGAFANSMIEAGWPVASFLQGAAGDIHFSDPTGRDNHPMEALGGFLAETALQIIDGLEYRQEVTLGGGQVTIDLPYRQPSEAEIAGTIPGAQRFVDPAIYDRGMARVLQRIAERGTQPAELQALHLDDWTLVSIPAEYFCALGLQIKVRCQPRHVLVVGYANGMIGYVPTAAAMARGGYETTFAGSSRMAAECGRLLADAAVELVLR